MRLNVYAEEITAETELVMKEVTDEKFGTRTFYGVRVYLKSPPELHADPEDDDRSAITLWVPWTRAGGHDFEPVEQALRSMLDRLGEAMLHDGQDVSKTRLASEMRPGDKVNLGMNHSGVLVEEPEGYERGERQEGIVVLFLEHERDGIRIVTPLEIAGKAEAKRFADKSWMF